MGRERNGKIEGVIPMTEDVFSVIRFGRKTLAKIREWMEKLGNKMFYDGVTGKFYRLLTCAECQKLELKRLYMSVKGKALAERRNSETMCEECRLRQHGVRWGKASTGMPRTKKWRNNMSKGQVRALRNGRRKNGVYGKIYVIDGIMVRSTLEACYYVWLRRNRIPAIVAPKAIEFEYNGRIVRYLPDFYRKDTKRYVEVKPGRYLTEAEQLGGFPPTKKNNIWKVKYLQSRGVPIDFATETDGWCDRTISFLLKKMVNKKTREISYESLMREYKEKVNK